MSRPSASQRPRATAANSGDSLACSVYTSPTLPPLGGSVKLPMLANNSSSNVNGPSAATRATSDPSVGRLSIENIHLTHQNGTLARELAHSRYTIHALRQIVTQKEAVEQRAQQELKQSLWRVRVLEAVVGRMSEQLVLLMGEQRGGFEEGTDIVSLAREVAVGEFYRQHAALQQRELDAIRGELDVRDEDDYDPEEEDYDDENQQLDIAAGSAHDLTGKVSPPPPMITVTDSDADREHSPTFDNDQSPSSSSSEDDDLEDYLDDAEEQYGAASVGSLDPISSKMYDAESAVVEERPGLRADVLFARMRIVA